MKPILTQVFAGLLLLLASQAFGQTLTTNFVITAPATPAPYAIGSKIVIELRVTGYTNIESMQFPITFNKDAIRFDSLTNAVFSNWTVANFSSYPTQGRIGVSWQADLGADPSGVTLPNNTAIFKLHFTGIGNGTTTVNISGTPGSAPPIPVEIARQGSGPLPPNQVNYSSGGTPTFLIGVMPPPPPLVGFKIVANTLYIPQGERGCMPVTVNDFNSIVSMQWAMHWNNAVLNFDCTRSFNLAGWSSTDFNSVYTPGTLLAGWADPAGAGVTKVNGARIVDICFKAIGAPGASTTVTIDGVGFPPGNGSAEAYNASSVNVWTTGGPNGASGVSAPINIIVTTPPPTDVTYTIDTIAVAPDTQGCVAVKVKNFTAITSSEFALSYNPAQLTYVSTQFGTNPLNLQASNITHIANPGVIKFLWANANGVTVPNDVAIFSACFNVIAPPPTKSNISFTSTACPTVTGIGTAVSTGGVSMARNSGWIKSMTQGPNPTTTNLNCNGVNTGSITLDNGTGPTPTGYAWAGPNGFTSSAQNISNLAAGTYTVTVTYSGGNTVVVNPTAVTQPPALSETHTVNTVSCFNGSNGAINLTPAGGTPAYTYLWTNGSTAQDPSGLQVNVYSVTITDTKGCTLVAANIAVSGFQAIALANPVITPVSCAGLSTGSIVINPTGGAGGYTYIWSNNVTTKDLTNMPANTYTVRVTDANGCSSVFPPTGSYAIPSPPPLVSNLVGKTDVKCFGTATGTANVSASGGTGTLNYCWTTGAGPCKDPAALLAGTYTAIVTDQNGCTSTVSSVVIANPPSALAVTGTTTDSPCFEQASGGICLTPAGGWGSYAYAWAGPMVPPAIACPTNIPGGLYTVTVTDASQCSTTQTFTVSGAPAIAQNQAVQHVTCFEVNNGGINLNLSGGNPPYNVDWSNTLLKGESISTLTPGSYQPTVTDSKGCSKTFPAVVVNGPAGPINTSNAVVTETGPNGGSIDLNSAGGTGNPNTWGYSWVGPNGFTASTQDIGGASVKSGTYTVTITDSNACTLSFTFFVPEGNVVANASVVSVVNACALDGCILLSIPPVAVTQTPFTIDWGFGTMQTNSLAPSICNLSSGIYNITITAANGNSVVLTSLPNNAPIEVKQLQPASVDALSQNPFDEQHDGKITLTPTVAGPLTYHWGAPLTSTSNQVSGLDSGLYVVTITNMSSGCTAVKTFKLNRQYPALVVTTDVVTNPNCSTVATGAIDLKVTGGNDPYEYNWTGPSGFVATTQDINNLMPGFYSVTVSDYNDTIKIRTFTLAAQSNLDITNVNETSLYPSGHQVSGATVCDGEASVVFIPGVGTTTIVWSNGVTGPNNSTLCGGAYSVTVTDAAGCSSVWTDVLTAPPAITSTPESTGVSCFGDCNGSAKIKVSGGFAPYEVRWSTGQVDPAVFPSGFSQAVNLCGGNYTVTITDKNGVTTTATVNVIQPAEIVASFATTTPRSFNACDGELLIDATGAIAPVTYVWSGSFGHSGNGERADNLCSGEFVEFYITDANGCTAYATDSVPYPEDGCFRLSPVITPGQQDGKNDNVHITCVETSIKNHIEIYNRWGQLVFEADNYTNEDSDREHNWNGLTKSGTPFAEGVYYYVFTFTYVDDQGQLHDDVRKGAINLLQ